jgi:hypothetical protein
MDIFNHLRTTATEESIYIYIYILFAYKQNSPWKAYSRKRGSNIAYPRTKWTAYRNPGM